MIRHRPAPAPARHGGRCHETAQGQRTQPRPRHPAPRVRDRRRRRDWVKEHYPDNRFNLMDALHAGKDPEPEPQPDPEPDLEAEP